MRTQLTPGVAKAGSDQRTTNNMAKKNVLPIAFTHSADFDGMCCAALLDKYFNGEIEIHPINYGDKELRSDTAFLDAFDVKGRDVYICDFSLKPNLMKKVIDLSNQTVWLDHHVSAIKDVLESSWYQKMLTEATKTGEPIKLAGIQCEREDVPYSGAYLTWAWLFNNCNAGLDITVFQDEETKKWTRELNIVEIPGEPGLFTESTPLISQAWIDCPQFIKNIAAYDTFKFEFVKQEEAVVQQFGMKAIGLNFDTKDMWKALLSDTENDELVSYDDISKKQQLTEMIEKDGRAVLAYNVLYQYPRINKAAYPIKLKVNGKNLRGLAINVNGYNSEVFEPIYDPEKTDFFIEYYYNKDHWSYGVYIPADKIDKISAVDIVRSFDPEKGGGHRGSAGGNSDKLLKELQQ